MPAVPIQRLGGRAMETRSASWAKNDELCCEARKEAVPRNDVASDDWSNGDPHAVNDAEEME
ncbi:hypothetical protein DOTSEDRAFT_47671 [Dothistroma septosporum NZE10]|uniref:Uncharacterized protein n=1 Tax=Dothistroma septosporum (strain NZE10 / CBS 128990) TaxID=675120 RepID=N1PCN5_DOTSN|nr:hypothetical protein DOTSEDRAFT_47671 [Dothistroma septosporum NZE10]